MNVRVPLRTVAKMLPSRVPDWLKGREKDADRAETLVDVEDAEALAPALVVRLKDAASKDMAAGLSGAKGRWSLLMRVVRYHQQPDAGQRTVADVNDLATCLKDVVEQSSPERRWLYREMADGAICPAYVANIEYKKRYGRDEPARTELTLCCLRAGAAQHGSVNFYRSDISALLADEDAVGEPGTAAAETAFDAEGDEDEDGGAGKGAVRRGVARRVRRKIVDILAGKKLLLESEALYEQYKAEVPAYAKFRGAQGTTATADGLAFYVSTFSTWRDEVDYNVRVAECEEDGVPAQLVLDDQNPEKVPFQGGYSFWSAPDDDELDPRSHYAPPPFWKGRASYVLPVHPYILAFDLRMRRQSHVWVHAARLRECGRDEAILDKLVIPPGEKGFVTMLVKSADLRMEDIVRGKTAGVFVLSVGPPGTGKTLTAEVYAAAMGRALYTVQCSQLGIEPKDIEARLSSVMKRAVRWGAVLLLDEADVYIRSRGTDVTHNAIVGVFLRVVERYAGLLFATTNLPDVDDAIRSRASAVLRYKPPGPALLPAVWRVLCAQFEVRLPEADVARLCARWPDAVGRDVKNVLALTRRTMAAAGLKAATAGTVEAAAAHLDMPSPAVREKGGAAK